MLTPLFGQTLAQIPTSAVSADDVLSPYIYVFYAAFVVSFIFTPVMRTIAIYYNIIDEPDAIRKMHNTPVAYLGGVAVFLGWMAGLALSQFLSLHRSEPGLLPYVHVRFSIVLGACVIVILGLWDDIRRINPWMKIGGQVFAAVCLLIEGVGVNCAAPLLAPLGARIQHHLGPQLLSSLGLAAQPLPLFPEPFVIAVSSVMVIALVVFCCNATNLMDGLDGLCGGVTAIIAAGFLFLAVHMAMYGGGINSNWDALRVVLGLALLGALLGFIPYNFNPASIFMGDTGSMFLGFACATTLILMAQERPKWFLASMVIFALPVLDTILAFARRYVNGRPVFSPDKFHFHHQLVARGFSVKQTVIISYGLAIAFALLGVTIVFMRTRYAVAVYLVVFGSIIVAAYKMGMVHEKPRVVTRNPLDADDLSSAAQRIDSSTVLEVRERAGMDELGERVPGAAGWIERERQEVP
ncbi:MAG TPA: MraY family glycosyltransferase [Tepidisphaeraceae bacterium]|nr:MraY family glycosyltransferase [Tepidisphaeraceae bacterium]